MNTIEFRKSGLAADSAWYVDSGTNELVGVCDVCGAEGRQHPARDPHFTLTHHPLCPVGLNMSRAERHALATGQDEPPADEPSETEVVYVRRPLWSLLMEGLEQGLEARGDLADVALHLLRDGGGASLTPRLREALEAFLAEYREAQPDERRALEQLGEGPTPVALREPDRRGRDGDAPVLVQKSQWDQLGNLLSATIGSAGALAELLLRLVEVLDEGVIPEAGFLEELRDDATDAIEACGRDRKMVERVMAALHWAPVV